MCVCQEETLGQLEESIKATQEAAMEAADSESIITSVTGGNQDGVCHKPCGAGEGLGVGM